MAPQPAPDNSSTYVLTLDQVENPLVRTGVNYWRALRGDRRMPARPQLSPRDIAGILRHLVILRVLDDGTDYEYRLVGDAQVQAYGFNFQNLRISQIKSVAPEFGQLMLGIYELVRTTRDPFVVRGWIGKDIPDSKFVYHESAFLPLGQDGETVDHIVVVSSYVPKALD
ncbi:MAG TPA: PAS domain-containing protein [Rhizomicrobium sp.]|nr:PAS domain-containing protein [Rhizomicrobium sp.]